MKKAVNFKLSKVTELKNSDFHKSHFDSVLRE